tara:strand:- start:1149 stop:1538 length:390 start_codon:yes stop_codon:yes gene_type:complete
MGLDMYLTGDKFTPTHDDRHKRAKVDGFEVESQRLSLGYWRKHWALHKCIEQDYVKSGGKILLEADFLLEIADAVEQGNLPEADYSPQTDAYHKEPEQVANTVKILRDAADWLDRDDGFWRSVEYHGSW